MAAREMTLAEWVDRLPPKHGARDEYALLTASRDVAAQADAQPAVAAVPEGWVMVPREPTSAMRSAALGRNGPPDATWAAMLSAAPAAPASEGVEARQCVWPACIDACRRAPRPAAKPGEVGR